MCDWRSSFLIKRVEPSLVMRAARGVQLLGAGVIGWAYFQYMLDKCFMGQVSVLS